MKICSHLTLAGAAAPALLLAVLAPAGAAAAKKPLYQTDPILARGLNYLLQRQNPQGSWMPQIGPAVTAMVVRALVRGGYAANHPAIVRAMKFIESTRQPDGGFYAHYMLQNYNTCLVLSTLTALPGDTYKKQIRRAQKYLLSLQHVAGQKNAKGRVLTKNSSWYGGVGYSNNRPDLSNTSFFIQALRDSGVPTGNPAMRRALVFVSRCQENSETNPLPFARGLHGGGFIYTPVNGGQSQFGDTDHLHGPSTLTAYGSMTYAGLKSMVYCGLTKTDPRVKAAVKWIRRHWTLRSNPGTGGGKMGLFYYYLMFGRALHALGVNTITDVNGIKHNWRRALHRQLAALQLKNGAWKNLWAVRWLEAHPDLVTAYSCLALENADRTTK